MFSFFKKKKPAFSSALVQNTLAVDMHSHLLPGIDDGAETIEESETLIQRFVDLGYKKAILTPHIMSDSYKNTPEGIREKLEILKPIAQKHGLEIEAAAEYYIDEGLYQKLTDKKEILTFGAKKYALIETSYLNEASYLNHVVFELQSNGITPILAHPERYSYLYKNFDRYEEMVEKGLLFQINLNSLVGYYSPTAQKIAERLIDKKLVHFVGTDCHSVKHTHATEKAMQSKYFEKLLQLPLLNNSLL